MKIEFHANDYMDIYGLKTLENGATVAGITFGKIYKQNGREFTSKPYENKYLADVDLFNFMHMLGFNLDNIKGDFTEYVYEKEAFIRIKKFQDTDIIYSFLDNFTDEEIASSTDFMGLILKEVFNKENNASL